MFSKTILHVTKLEKIRSLDLETATPDSLTIKWDAETISPSLQYRITIGNVVPNLNELKEKHNESKTISGELHSHKFIGLKSGCPYEIEIMATSKIKKEGKELDVATEPMRKIFMTKPHPPFNLRVDESTTEEQRARIIWDPSDTSEASYEVSWKQIDNDCVY